MKVDWYDVSFGALVHVVCMLSGPGGGSHIVSRDIFKIVGQYLAAADQLGQIP